MTAAPFSDRVSSLASWRGELPRQLVEPLQRQLDVVKGLAEHERELQQQVAEPMVAPVDADTGGVETYSSTHEAGP